MDCYEAIDLMGDAIDERLAPAARSGLQEHLDECPSCCHYMEQILLTRDALGHLPAPEGSSGHRADLTSGSGRRTRPTWARPPVARPHATDR